MKIYNYDKNNVFTGASTADPDPLDKTNWLIPSRATTKKPPVTGGNETVTWDSVNDTWVKQPDFRGEVYWLPSGAKIEISEVGVSKPENALTEEPDLRTLEQVINETLDAVKFRHSQVLFDLSGRATTEERDTWPLQKEWAKAYKSSQGEHEETLLLGLMLESEISALGDGAAMAMADKILLKSAAMDLLTSKAGGLKRKSDALIENASDKNELTAITDSLEQDLIVAVQEFKTLTGG